MNFLGFNITRSSTPTEKKSAPFSASTWLRGEPSPPTTTLRNAYHQSAWVYRAVNVLAEQVANIPFLFSDGERGRESLLTSGPIVDFYNRPHPHINRFQYWELRILWLMLRGECIRIPIYDDGATEAFKNQKSKIKNILILDPSRFQHIVQDNELVGWRYTAAGPNAPLASQVFIPEEVWFERLPDPFDFWRGLPPLYAAELAAKTDFSAANYMHGVMDNNGDMGLIVRTSEQLEENQREQVLAELRNRKRGGGCADAPLLLWGSAEVIQPRLSSADLQFLENRRFSRAEICAAFGVPEEIVVSTSAAKYDVMDGARQNFIENRVAPLCARLEAEENATTIPALLSSLPRPSEGRGIKGEGSSSSHANGDSKFKNIIGWFDIENLPIMQAARRARLLTAKTGFDMGIPFNELNRVLDLGFKPLPHGNTCYLSSTLQAVGHLNPGPNNNSGGDAFHGVPALPQTAAVSPRSDVAPSTVSASSPSKDSFENFPDLVERAINLISAKKSAVSPQGDAAPSTLASPPPKDALDNFPDALERAVNLVSKQQPPKE